MAVNQFRQRLLAAGASPERAGKLIEERTMKIPGMEGLKVPGVDKALKAAAGPKVKGGVKPMGPEEWYDEDFADDSIAILPDAFRAPKYGDPTFPEYFDYVFGAGSYARVAPTTLSQAPNYATAKTSTDLFDKAVVESVESGLSWPQTFKRLDTIIKSGAIQVPEGFTTEETVTYVRSIWNEYNRYGKANEKAYQEALKANKDFQYQMPDRRLKYGAATDFKVGTVDILTNPRAKSLYDAFVAKNTNTATQAKYKAWLASEFTRLGRTPWIDEAARRDSLKGRRARVRG